MRYHVNSLGLYHVTGKRRREGQEETGKEREDRAIVASP